MLAGQPLAASIGLGTKARLVTPCALDLNGNAVTVSNAVWAAMKPSLKVDADGKIAHPIAADALKPVIDSYRSAGKSFNMGIFFRCRPTTTISGTGWPRVASIQAFMHQ